MKEADDNFKIIARNRKARYDFQIESTIEAGIALLGTEVKSLREGKINISDAYASVENGSLFLKNLHISPYKTATDELNPTRARRLLLHRREIRKLQADIEQKGWTLIPLTIYFKRNIVKIELGLAFGRRKYDKRQAIAKADSDRRIRQATKHNKESK